MLVFCALALIIPGYAVIPVGSEVIDLSASQIGNSRAFAINNHGQVTGQSGRYAFFWDASEGMQSLGTIRGGVSKGNGINDAGQVVGKTGSADIGWQAFIWDRDGGMRSIGAHGAQAINNHGQVVGGKTVSLLTTNAFIWSQDGGLVSLGTFGGYNSYAYGVNDHGQVVGRYDGYTAFFWDPVDGMTPPGAVGGYDGHALAINNGGEVAGWAMDSHGNYRAFIWSRNEGMTNLGTLGGIYSQAHGINDHGEVVGWSHPLVRGAHAFYWSEATGMIDLNLLLPEDSAWDRLTHATDINNNGQIVGTGITKNGDTHAFLITPVPDNIKPISDAGADQEVYAFIDGYALVQLDGTGSTDADEDALEYYWYSDANELVATEAEPNVLLPVGEHVIDLVVYDGIEDSEPDSCVVTVVEALEGRVAMLPRVLNLKSHGNHVTATVILPDGISIDDLDESVPWRLLPGDIEALSTRTTSNRKWQKVYAVFDRQAVNDVLGPGEVEVTVYGRLSTGKTVGGTDSIQVTDPGRGSGSSDGSGGLSGSVAASGEGSSAGGSNPQVVLGPGTMSMTFHAGSPGITYVMETSTDLRNWTTEGVVLSEPDVEGNRTATVPRDGPRRFMRLVVAEE